MLFIHILTYTFKALVLMKANTTSLILKQLAELQPEPHEWEALERIRKFLNPWSQVTNYMCSTQYPTSPQIITLFNKLYDFVNGVIDRIDSSQEFISDDIVAAAEAAREVLHKYYSKTNHTTMLCTALDPRKKLAYFGKHQYRQSDIDATRVK